jgi:hypothetical protein
MRVNGCGGESRPDPRAPPVSARQAMGLPFVQRLKARTKDEASEKLRSYAVPPIETLRPPR